MDVDETHRSVDKNRWPENLKGLTTAEVRERLAQFGRNEVRVHLRRPRWREIGSRYVGLVPFMAYIVVILAVTLTDSHGNRGYFTLGVTLLLINVNALLDYWANRRVQDITAALQSLALPRCSVRRDGAWCEIDSGELVPDDVIELVNGMVIPADVRIERVDHDLTVDLSVITGEAFPRHREAGDEVPSGCTVRSGGAYAVVLRTGLHSLTGINIGLLASVETTNRLSYVQYLLTHVLAGIALLIASIILLVVLFRDDTTAGLALVSALAFAVSATPTSMALVTTSTLALSARRLLRDRILVHRLSALEELAGMEVLFSDKTGTLTYNKPELGDPILAHGFTGGKAELLEWAALSCRRVHADTFDEMILASVPSLADLDAKYEVLELKPFDPSLKHSEATVRRIADGVQFRVAKGAPATLLRMCGEPAHASSRFEAQITELSSTFTRCIAVAMCAYNPDTTGEYLDDWQVIGAILIWLAFGPIHFAVHFLALLPVADQDREDAAPTISEARSYGIDVKMITGDDHGVAAATAKRLGLGDWIVSGAAYHGLGRSINQQLEASFIEHIDGFAELLPEDKYNLITAMQQHGYVTGMTGDGVNDVPALRRADIGIAAVGACDAARAAADIALLESAGLPSIVTAVKEGRRTFLRLHHYIMFRLTMSTIIIILYSVLAIAFAFFIPTWSLTLTTLFNNVTAIATATDRSKTSKTLLRWNMLRTSLVSVSIGLMYALFGILYFCLVSPQFVNWWTAFGVDTVAPSQITSAMYLYFNLSIQSSFYVVRATPHLFFRSRPSILMMIVSGINTTGALMIAVYWPVDLALGPGNTAMQGMGWARAGLSIAYCALVFLVIDIGQYIVGKMVAKAAQWPQHAAYGLFRHSSRHPPPKPRTRSHQFKSPDTKTELPDVRHLWRRVRQLERRVRELQASRASTPSGSSSEQLAGILPRANQPPQSAVTAEAVAARLLRPLSPALARAISGDSVQRSGSSFADDVSSRPPSRLRL